MHNTGSIALRTVTIVTIPGILGNCDGPFSERAVDDDAIRVCGGTWNIPGNHADFTRGSGTGWFNGITAINPLSGLVPHILTVEAPSSTTLSNGVELGDGMLSRFWHGDIAEIAAYNTTHSSTSRNHIESYLAIKYGITLSNSGGGTNGDYTATNNNLIWDASDNSGYHIDVIGIGRDDSTALLQKQSHQFDDTTRIYLSTLTSSNTLNSGVFLLITSM